MAVIKFLGNMLKHENKRLCACAVETKCYTQAMQLRCIACVCSGSEFRVQGGSGFRVRGSCGLPPVDCGKYPSWFEALRIETAACHRGAWIVRNLTAKYWGKYPTPEAGRSG